MPLMKMQHDKDPAMEIMKKVGDLSKFTLFGNQVLLGVYERPSKLKDIKRNDGTVGNLYIPDSTRAEDQHQGKAAICLAKGPAAFVSDENFDFRGQTVDVGEWVAIFVSDGRKIVVNGQLCRIVEDQFVRLKIPTPDCVY